MLCYYIVSWRIKSSEVSKGEEGNYVRSRINSGKNLKSSLALMKVLGLRDGRSKMGITQKRKILVWYLFQFLICRFCSFPFLYFLLLRNCLFNRIHITSQLILQETTSLLKVILPHSKGKAANKTFPNSSYSQYQLSGVFLPISWATWVILMTSSYHVFPILVSP